MGITESIQELLHAHDTVAIPGFGIFKSTYRSAGIHPAHHIFEPPHKSIVFKKTDSDDGLLSYYLSEKNDLSPATAVNQVSVFVNDLKRKLEKTGEAGINGVGTFKYDIEKQLHFIQDGAVNFLTSSYGLDQFISYPILCRDERQEKVLSQKKQPAIAMTKENSILLWLLLASIFALVTAVYFIFRSGIIAWWHS